MKTLVWIILLCFVNVIFALHRDCGVTPRVDHATAELEDEEDVVVATYKCDRGYQLRGDDRIYCDLNTDEWLDEPPVCEEVEQTASGGTSDITDSNIGRQQEQHEADTRTRKKNQEISEDENISSEFARELDMSCVGKRVKAPNIDNGRVIKYDRRRKDGNVFLVAFYSCNRNYELEDLKNAALYCSQQSWIGSPPVCVSTDDYGEDYDGEDDGEEEEEQEENAEEIRRQQEREREEQQRRYNLEQSQHERKEEYDNHEKEHQVGSGHHESAQKNRNTELEEDEEDEDDVEGDYGEGRRGGSQHPHVTVQEKHEEHSQHVEGGGVYEPEVVIGIDASEEKRRQQEEERQEEERRITQERRLEEESRLEEERRIAQEKRLEEERRYEEEKRLEEERNIAEERRLEGEGRSEEERRIAEERRLEEGRRLEGERRREEERRLEEEGRRTVEDSEDRYYEEKENGISGEREEERENRYDIHGAGYPTVLNESCGSDRGGCDHECRMVLYAGETVPKTECSCYSGFTQDSQDSRKCHDIDECQTNNGGCEQVCINVPGSFECSCERGLQIDTVTGNTCVDINECLLRNGHGPCQDTCHNTWGSYTCSCDGLPGTRLSYYGHNCEDTGECAKNNGGCSHKCLTTLGRIFCLCPDGYYLTADWKTCEDVDECQNPEISSKCPYGCENLPGSYRCLDQHLEQRFGEEEEDDEDDETERREEEESIKKDVENSIYSQPKLDDCGDGYRPGPGNECVDIDECADGVSGCQFCTNVPGGFECTCPEGYELADDEKTCRDIDECQEYTNEEDGSDSGNAICSHQCVNLLGSFLCKCPENFHLHTDMRTCVRDYCEDLLNPNLNKTRCSHYCEDGSEGFSCNCPNDLVLDTDFKTCIGGTEDECQKSDGHNLCRPGTCISAAGQQYSCNCPAGYMEKEGRCHDIDECHAEVHGCSHYCSNNDGSYECSCPQGLTLSEHDSKNCVDIDECKVNSHICDNLICHNTHGSYKCVCPEGQEIQGDGSCGHSNACAVNNGGCSHLCSSHNGYAECNCPAGMTLTDDGRSCIEQNPCLENNGGCSQICDPIISSLCSCQAGYELHSDGKTCIDHDECLDNNGGCSQICSNKPGSYECLCKDGFKMFNTSCIDIDECSLGLHNCDTMQTCINALGTFKCDCPNGFTLNEHTNKCLDIDECFESNGNCSHICSNLPGSYQCSCPPGLALVSDKTTCEFINKCELNNGGCSHGCEYSFGLVTCSCPHGYHLDESQKNCVDINECENANGGCSHVCENHLGRFACICSNGYELESNGISCTDVDECIEKNGNCSNICINLLGSYSCACEAGYELQSDLHTCIDVNECALNIHDCSHFCINNPGGYECSCPSGYKLGRNQFMCEDINECEETFNGGCSNTCVNTLGSFHCDCPSGHNLASDNRTCIDIDECTHSDKRCSHDCRNTVGGYECLCPFGYELAQDQVTCVDINECQEHHNNGGCSHMCENTEGAYICHCRPGFQLGEDKRTCYDIDECLEKNGGCSQFCINFEGGYKCDCSKRHSLGSDGKTCQQQNVCLYNNGGCDQICGASELGPKCSCREGFFLDSRDNKTCHDINECRFMNPCQQACENTVGSYVCACHPGYIKDHTEQCVDINECDILNGGCSAQAQCENLLGSFRCICPNGYKLSTDMKTCLEIKDLCQPLKAPKNGEIHCTRSRHKTQLYYRTRCKIWCHKGYKLHGPSDRHCNGTGHWDDHESLCLPLSCPPLSKPENGVILPPSCLQGGIYAGERCLLHCAPGYIPSGRKAAICNADQTWSTNSSFRCIPASITASLNPTLTSHSSRGGTIKPKIQCPRDTILILPKGQKTIHVRLEQPKTNVDFHKYVDSHPDWAKHLEAHLGVGVHVITFRARSPISNLNAMCRTVITVKETKPPTIAYCPSSFEVQLRLNEHSRSISWKEPIFQAQGGSLKQVYKSKIPGERLDSGIHNIVYVATDRDGQSSKCEFKIAVKSFPLSPSSPIAPSPPLVSSPTYGVHHQPPSSISTVGYEANRLANHESYLLCPGKQAMKIETNYPIHVPIGCFIKNVRSGPVLHHHRRRHQSLYNNNILRHYSAWNDPFIENKAHTIYKRKLVKTFGPMLNDVD